MGCASSSRSVNTIDEDYKKKETNNNEMESEIYSSKIKSNFEYKRNQTFRENKSVEKIEEVEKNVADLDVKETTKEEKEIILLKCETETFQPNIEPAKALFLFEEEQSPEYLEVQNEEPFESQYQPPEKSENLTEVILKQLQTFISNNKIADDAIIIRVCNSVNVDKDEYDKFEISQTTKFSLVGRKKKIKWSKKQFSHLVDDVTKYFDQAQLHDYFGFEWTTYLLEDEKQKLDVKLRKFNPKLEKFEDEEFETSASEKVKIILIFGENDANGITKLKEINDYKKFNKEFDFYPIFGSDIKKKEEAIEKIDFLTTLGVKDTELYFLKKMKDKKSKPEKRINYISDDNKKEIISTAVVFDKNGYIRYVGNPEGLIVDNIKSYSDPEYFNEMQYKKSKDYLLTNLAENNEAVCSAAFILAKTELYDSNLKLVECFYERKKVDIKSNAEQFKKLFSIMKIDAKSTRSKEIKLKHKGESLNLHVNQILSKMEVSLEDIEYSGAVSVIKRYHIALPKKMKKFRFSHAKKKFTSFQFKLKSDMFEKLQAPLLDQMGQLRLNPILDKIKSVSICPMFASKFPQSLNLLDAEENKEIQINLSEANFKLFIILGNSKNANEKTEVTQYLSKTWNNIASKENLLSSTDIYLIYTGNLLDDAKEHIDDSFPEQKIYLLNSSINSNFPYAIDNEGPRVFIIMNNPENIIKYIGTPSEISISDTLVNFAEGNEEISYKQNHPMTYESYKKNFKKKLKEFFKLIEDSFVNSELFYKPIIEYSLTKECQYKNKELLNIYCKNIRINILIKKISENLITGHEGIKQILKTMQKEWGVSVKVLKVPCVDLKIEEKICDICKAEIKPVFSIDAQEDLNEFFFDQEKSVTYCVECERGLKHHTTNLIYLKYQKEKEIILSEVIQGFYEMNVMARSHLENSECLTCSICNTAFTGHHVAWMSLIHLNHVADYEEEITRPVVLCERKCFPFLQEKKEKKKTINDILYALDLTREEKKKLKLCAIDKNNSIFKKVILPI